MMLPFTLFFNTAGRSIYRPTQRPQLSSRWADEEKSYHLQHANLEQQSIFDQYNQADFAAYSLPNEAIPLRHDPAQTVTGSLLKKLLEKLVSDLQNNHRSDFITQHFTILKQRDYNQKTHTGLIVLRFKHYPFVVKLFMETPQSFVAPFSKGFEPCCFFVMSGGTSRYLLGFSRIKNREAIQQQIDADAYWRDKISTPRKWFWQPKNNRWFEVTSKNLGPSDRTVKLPAVYAIICDAIDADAFQMTNKEDRKIGIELSHLFGTRIDSHINNFLVEKKSRQFILIDTEHFATQVGLRQPIEFDGYVSWYWQLSKKCIGNCFFRTKEERLFFQRVPPPIIAN